MGEQQYTRLELEAMKWLKETDEMQFEQWELLAMFAEHCFALQRERRRSKRKSVFTQRIVNALEERKIINTKK